MRTLGYLALALQVQGAAAPDGGAGGNLLGLILRSSPIAKVVLLVLILFSVVSWAVILYKLWTFRRAERQSATFLDVFRKSTKFSEVNSVCVQLQASPLVGVFQAGYQEVNQQVRQPAGGPPQEKAARPTAAPGEASMPVVSLTSFLSDSALLPLTMSSISRCGLLMKAGISTAV